MAALVLLGAHLPVLLAGFLTVFNFVGDHELQIGFGDNRLEITLHHRDSELKNAGLSAHTHSFLESILIGSSVSETEQDHHFGVTRETVVSEEDELRVNEMSEVIGFQPSETEIPSFLRIPSPTIFPVPSRFDRGGSAPPPLLLRRGVMMRI